MPLIRRLARRPARSTIGSPVRSFGRPSAAALALALLLGSVGLTTVPSSAQTLDDRIAELKARRAQEEAERARGGEDLMKETLRKLYYTRITLRLDRVPAKEAFSQLRRAAGLTIIGRFADDPLGFGLDPDQPIVMDVQGLPVITVLELMLDQLATIDECTWQLRRGYVEVGTKERLASNNARLNKVIPIQDILYEPPRFENAPGNGIVYGAGFGYSGYGYPGFGYPAGGTATGTGIVTGGPGVAGFRQGRGLIGTGTGYGGTFGGPSGRPEGDNSRRAFEERAERIIELIVTTIEPTAWQRNGGTWASIAYVDGSLVISAPDFILREIVGYPKVSERRSPR